VRRLKRQYSYADAILINEALTATSRAALAAPRPQSDTRAAQRTCAALRATPDPAACDKRRSSNATHATFRATALPGTGIADEYRIWTVVMALARRRHPCAGLVI
jgi:hypothetical protein